MGKHAIFQNQSAFGKICTTSEQDFWTLAKFNRAFNNLSPKLSFVVSFVQSNYQYCSDLRGFLWKKKWFEGFALCDILQLCDPDNEHLHVEGRFKSLPPHEVVTCNPAPPFHRHHHHHQYHLHWHHDHHDHLHPHHHHQYKVITGEYEDNDDFDAIDTYHLS